MRASEALDAALGAGGGTGRIAAAGDDGAAEIDAVAIGPIGVRVRAVRIGREVDVDVATEAAALPERVRVLSDRMVPVEVDPGLGGAVLRSHPDDMREREFWELDVRRRSTTVRKQRVMPDGQRETIDFTLTREQLGRLVDQVR